MIGLVQNFFTFYIFGKGKEFICKSGMFDFIIGITIANYIYIAWQVKPFELLHFSIILRKRIFFIETNYVTLFIELKTIGQNIFGFNAKLGNNRIDKRMKAI